MELVIHKRVHHARVPQVVNVNVCVEHSSTVVTEVSDAAEIPLN